MKTIIKGWPKLLFTILTFALAFALTSSSRAGDSSSALGLGSHGLATAVAPGATTISATAGGVRGSTTLTVTDAILIFLEVTPSNPRVPGVPPGLTRQFTATGTFSDGSTHDLTTTAFWSSSVTSAALISNAGLATAVAPGATTISATAGGVTGSTTLTVTDAILVFLEVTPSNPSVPPGLTGQFTATGTFSDGSTHDLTTTAFWSSSVTSAALISNAAASHGLATAMAPGATTISATAGGVTGSTTLRVTDAILVSLEVTPSNPSVPPGLTHQFTATGIFSDGSTHDLTTTAFWSSSVTSAALISNAAASHGLATAMAPGATEISATAGGVTGSTTLTVTDAILVSLEVTPSNPSVPPGLTRQFTATGIFSDGSTHDLTTTAFWSSSVTSAALISNGLLVTSSITSSFNGTPISTTNSIWFNANFSAKGIPASGATIFVKNSTIAITSAKGNFSYAVPDGRIVFSPSVSCATTLFDGAQWVTTVPLSGSDEILLSALGIKAPADLKAATVTWSGAFSADTTGISLSWKWGAAVYTSDMTQAQYNNLGVKPTHTAACLYNNSDHAGTPETVKKSVVGGARGGGGSNYTGSWSGTTSVSLCP